MQKKKKCRTQPEFVVQARKFWCTDSNKELLQNIDGIWSICENWLKILFLGLQRPKGLVES